MDVEQKAWLVMCAGDDREHGGNDGYADLPESAYLWDNTVPHSQLLNKGDRIVLRDKKTLLGVSVIERIEEDRETKTIKKCPACTKAYIKPRTTVLPVYKCYNASCGEEFDHPLLVHKEVRTYRSDHAGGWVDLRGRLSGKQLHELCIDTNPQHSLRRMRWQKFLSELGEELSHVPWRPLERTADRIAGGHQERTMRVRIGQAQFRQDLLRQVLQEMKGPVCAFTGPAPAPVLEAGHLYSYAAEGKHHPHGGLLMRRDIHTLFDTGLLAVDPATWTIDVTPGIRNYGAYESLHGQPLRVSLRPPQEKWLRLHWDQYRTIDTEEA